MGSPAKSTTPPMLSQHSRSQALLKEESCHRLGQATLNLAILIEIKPKRALVGFQVSSVAYPNLIGTKRLCCCCRRRRLLQEHMFMSTQPIKSDAYAKLRMFKHYYT